MPGRHITNRQVASYMHARQRGCTQIKAANGADISERTGRGLDQGGRAVRGPRAYRTRLDAFADVWPGEIEPLLRQDALLQARTLFAALQRGHPGAFKDGQVRTLERRVRQWRAVHGPAQVVMFPQEHPPGWQALLDFTVCNELAVTISGVVLPHRLPSLVRSWEEIASEAAKHAWTASESANPASKRHPGPRTASSSAR